MVLRTVSGPALILVPGEYFFTDLFFCKKKPNGGERGDETFTSLFPEPYLTTPENIVQIQFLKKFSSIQSDSKISQKVTHFSFPFLSKFAVFAFPKLNGRNMGFPNLSHFQCFLDKALKT